MRRFKLIHKFAIVFILVQVAFLFVACGKKGNTETNDESIIAEDTWKPLQVLEHTWKGFDEVNEDLEPWHPNDYYGGLSVIPEGEKYDFFPIYSWYGDNLYSLAYRYEEVDGHYDFFLRLNKINIVSMEEDSQRFYFSDLVLSDDAQTPEELINETEWQALCESVFLGRAHFVSIDVIEGNIYIFFVRYSVSDTEEWSVSNYYCLEMDRDFCVKTIIDFADELFGDNRSGQYGFPKGYVTKSGKICFIDEMKKELLLFSDDGKPESVNDIKDFIGDFEVNLIGRAGDGTPVFQSGSAKREVYFFTPEGVIFTGKGYMPCSNLDDVGELLVWKDGALIRWNVETGEAVKLCSLKGLESSCCIGIRKNTEGQIVLAYDDGDELCFYRYVVGKAEEKKISIGFYVKNGYIENCALDYERTHPGTTIEFVEIENPFYDYAAVNLLAERCKDGAGPDMMIFTTKAITEKMQKAGCLAPMSEMISEDTKKGLFDCVLELGTIEDDLYAVAYNVILDCFFVSKEDWARDSWTLKDFLGCYENKKNNSADLERFMSLHYSVDSQQLLYNILLQNLDDTAFIDMNSGNCDFVNPEFINILSFCKENADGKMEQEILSDEEQYNQMLSGKAFVYLFSGALGHYSAVREKLGKNYIPVGLPSESNQGFIADSTGYITVNSFSDNKDLAADFTEYVLSERCQVRYGSGSWIRKDVIKSHIREHAWGYDSKGNYVQQCIFVINNGAANVLGVDENGDSFVNEYITLMDNAHSYSTDDEIRAIISEEADAYFKGAKSAEEVAGIIQSRVMLYLEERK